MALVLNDRVKETSTTTGQGTLSLAGAATGFETFVTGIGDGNTTYYLAAHESDGTWELGIGTITDASPDTLARTTVIDTSAGNTTKIDFASGSKTIFCTLPAGKAVFLDADGDVTLGANLSVGGNLDVTGTFDLSDSNFTNAGDIQLDSITGDGDTNTKITFSGSDVITVTAGGDNQVTFTNGAIVPSTDNDIDLGTSSVEFKDAFFDGTVTSDAFAGPLTGNVTGNVSGTAATVTGAAQSNITSLGTLTTLTVDNVIINGTTIGHTDDTDLMTVADGVLTVAGEVSMTTLDIGGTNVTSTAAELNLVDGITAGTVSASLAVIADSNKDISGFRNVTLTGELDAATLDISGNADIDGTANLDVVDIDGAVDMATTLTLGGNADFNGDLDVDGTTNLDAVDIDGAVQIDGTVTVGVDDTGYDVKFFGATSGSFALWDESADSLLLTDSTPIKIGDSQDMTFYHDGSNSYITNATGALKLATETSGIAITIGHSTSEVTVADNLTVTGDLTVSGTTTTVNSTTVNLNDHNIVLDSGNSTSAVVNGAGITLEGGSGDDATFTYNTSGPKFELKLGSSYEDLKVAQLIASSLDIDGTITVGVDDTGYDVKFFGATSGKYMEWDESADQLDVTGSLDVTGNTAMVGTLTVGVDDTGHDVKFFGATSGKYMEWDESADQLDVTGSLDVTGNTAMVGTLTVGVDDTGHDVIFYGATSGAYLQWDESDDALETVGGATINIVKDKLKIGGTAVTTTAAELNVLDAVTAGTVTASLGVVVDSNKDIGTFRNITLSGELDAGSLDVSGNADIDGTLEADAITVDGTAIGSLFASQGDATALAIALG